MQKLCVAATFVAAVALGSCDRALFNAPQPPLAPSPSDIAQTVQETNAAMEKMGSPSAQTYAAAGYVTVEEKCGEFFDRLTLYKNNSNFLSAEIATAGATAAGMLSLLAASTTAVGIVGLGAGLVAASIANFQNFATVTPYPLETRQLVFAALLTAKTAKPANKVTDPYDARSTVAAYAHYCTYAGIATLSQQAIQNGANNTVNAGPTTIPDTIRLMIANLAGGPLTDKQLALILLLNEEWDQTQRDAAVAAAALPTGQKNLLMNQSGFLKAPGQAIAGLAAGLTQTYPAFAAVVEDLRATLVKAKQTKSDKSALILELSTPRASVFAPVPTPRVIIGR
jgi:hypothetical protein